MKENLQDLYLKRWGLRDWEIRSEKRIEGWYGRRLIERLAELIDLGDKNVLDVGSGWGEFVVEADLRQINILGVEPDKQKIDLCKMRSAIFKSRSQFLATVGEVLPFRDNTFDIVVCGDVLEHTRDPESVIKEALRVTKPEGFFYVIGPNYIYPYETHYKLYFIPFIPKSINRVFLFLLGRNPGYLESLNFVTTHRIINALKRSSYTLEIRNLTEEKIKNPSYSVKWKQFIAIIVNILKCTSLAVYIWGTCELLVKKVGMK
jgi:SAM-dependent methyltransferase